MKVVYTILGTFNSGGMERVLTNKANYLVTRGFEVVIVTTDQKGRKPFFDIDSSIKLIDLGINYTNELGKGLIQRGITYYKKQKLHKQKLKDLIFKIKPDITISMFDYDASFITEIQDGSKKFLEIHFSRFKRLQYGRRGIWRLIDYYRNSSDLKIVKKFDRFVVLTYEDKDYWGNLSNIEVIPNANSFETDRRSLLDNKLVLAIGRFDYQKGFDDLIHIWSKVNTQFPGWKLNIYGHGPLESEFQTLVNSMNLNNSVSLNPPVKDVEKIYSSHSIFAMTSRYEGLPMVLLEAQVCGLPMVSFACKCGPRDIIKNGINGFLIEEGNKDQFALALTNLMNNKLLRLKMGQSAIENSKEFSEDKIMGKWVELFYSVLKK